MQERKTIQLHIYGDAAGRWKLTWAEPLFPERYYHVDASLLQETSRDVRTALQCVVDAARTKTALGPRLKTLAKAGSELRKAIFLASAKEVSDALYVRDKQLPSLNNGTLLIMLNQRVYLPWGLAYDGDPDLLPDSPPDAEITPQLYGGFWCLKYQLCTLHEIIDPSGVKKPRANDEVEMLTVVNEPIWETAKSRIPDAERPMFDGTLARSDPPIVRSEDFFKIYKKRYRGIDLLYLYCHANGSKLALSGDDEISVSKLQIHVTFDDREPHPPCLVFLNGCQTAVGAENGGFMRATGGQGFCGFVGTEAKVPDLFALRFAARFFCHLLYEEMTVAEIMDKLRREHFPLGLVYSTCCHPLFKIKRITSAPAVPLVCNLSNEELQAATLL